MEIQSLSICVPTKGCVNECKFCVSRMHNNKYPKNSSALEIKDRLQFARDNGCNTLIFTGTGEPLQNKNYLEQVSLINQKLRSPFVCIELQTSGVMLTVENLTFLKETLNVKTISLSLSNIYDWERNSRVCGIPTPLCFDIDGLCYKIKKAGFNLR